VTDAPTEREDEGAWAKLRRRKVVQWGVAYVAGAWGFLQGFEYASDTFDWPHRLQQLMTIGLLIGLPIAPVIAWYHGDRGEQRVTRIELAILTLLFLVGGGLFWRYERANEATSVTMDSSATAPSSGSVSEPAVASADVRASIAVLPFENRSSRQDDTFLVDGIHDDILTQLSKIGAMKVIARTSVERFRDTRLSLRQIGKQLGVANVLEGGVQRAGDRVRITVQLIDVATEAHLWAESYDRELTAANIFEIQSEVAKAIAAALRATLTTQDSERLAAIPTQSLAAWAAYQNGRQQLAKRTVAALSEAQAFYREAIRHDPGFALAYVGLADATWLSAWRSGRPPEPATAEAEDLLGQALRLDPNLAEARVTLAKVAQERREFERAESLYREAIALNPGYTPAYHWYSGLLGTMNRDEEARRWLQKAVELDPMSVLLRSVLAQQLWTFGQFDESIREYSKAIEVDPSSPLPYGGIGQVRATVGGRLDEAAPYFEKAMQLDASAPDPVGSLGRVYLDLVDDAKLDRLLRDAARRGIVDTVPEAYLHRYRGERQAAVAIARKQLQVFARNAEALRLLRDDELASHDPAGARAIYERAVPELLRGETPVIDGINGGSVIDLAAVLYATGERERADRLMAQWETLIAQLKVPRQGPWGYGVMDVQAMAMRGQPREALAALRDAERSGWRGPYWRYYRDFDPALASIRDDPEFKAIFEDIERDMARQRAELAKRPKDAPLDLDPAG